MTSVAYVLNVYACMYLSGFAGVKECALAYVYVCACTEGTDGCLTLCWTLSRLWAGRVSGGAVENERVGLGSIRLPGRLSYCQMVRAGLLSGLSCSD